MRVDESLTRGLVSFQDSKRAPGFRSYRFKEAFSATLANRLLDESFPSLFFIGAAIVSNMAREICGRLENSTLANAANLTDTKQSVSIAQWIRTL